MIRLEVIGYLGNDAEVKEINGRKKTVFSIAANEKWKTKEGETKTKTTWVRCMYNTDKIAKYLTKGKLLYIDGTPYANAWEGKNGIQADLNINVNKLQFLNAGTNQKTAKAEAPAQGKGQESDDLPF